MKNYYCVNEKIEVTDHAIEQYSMRRKIVGINNDKIKEMIANQVKQSVLIRIKQNEEHRSHKGFIFVIKREKLIIGEKLVVVTIKLSNVRKKQYFSTDFSLSTVDNEKLGYKNYVKANKIA